MLLASAFFLHNIFGTQIYESLIIFLFCSYQDRACWVMKSILWMLSSRIQINETWLPVTGCHFVMYCPGTFNFWQLLNEQIWVSNEAVKTVRQFLHIFFSFFLLGFPRLLTSCLRPYSERVWGLYLHKWLKNVSI